MQGAMVSSKSLQDSLRDRVQSGDAQKAAGNSGLFDKWLRAKERETRQHDRKRSNAAVAELPMSWVPFMLTAPPATVVSADAHTDASVNMGAGLTSPTVRAHNHRLSVTDVSRAPLDLGKRVRPAKSDPQRLFSPTKHASFDQTVQGSSGEAFAEVQRSVTREVGTTPGARLQGSAVHGVNASTNGTLPTGVLSFGSLPSGVLPQAVNSDEGSTAHTVRFDVAVSDSRHVSNVFEREEGRSIKLSESRHRIAQAVDDSKSQPFLINPLDTNGTETAVLPSLTLVPVPGQVSQRVDSAVRESPTVTIAMDQWRTEFPQLILQRARVQDLGDGVRSFNVTLVPEGLGKLHVTVQGDVNQLSVQIVADKSSTQQLLQADLSQLRDSLQQQGVSLTQIDVRTGTDFSSAWQQSGQGGGSFGRQAPKDSYRQSSHQEADERSSVNGLEPMGPAVRTIDVTA